MRLESVLFCAMAFGLGGCASQQPMPTPTSVTQQPVAAPDSTPGAAVPGTVSGSPMPAPHQAATGTPEDARRHLLRGMAAIEIAKTKDDLSAAEDEFRAASEIAPGMPSAWFNLGKVQALRGEFTKAMDSYHHYLDVAPDAKDAQQVRDELVKLEFMQEQSATKQARLGTWIEAGGQSYTLSMQGDRILLKSGMRTIPLNEIKSTYPLIPAFPIRDGDGVEFILALRGHELNGVRNRNSVQADKCIVPPETSQVSGELDDAAHRIVLHYEMTSYLASTRMGLLTDDSCSGVTSQGRNDVTEVLYGPAGDGMLGMGLEADQVTFIGDGGPASAAGIQKGDRILAVDGVATRGMSQGELAVRLRGKPGTKVHVEYWRNGQAATTVVDMTRMTWSQNTGWQM